MIENKQPTITSIHKINLTMINTLCGHYITQCKSRVDAQLIKALSKDLITILGIKDDKDYGVIPIDNIK